MKAFILLLLLWPSLPWMEQHRFRRLEKLSVEDPAACASYAEKLSKNNHSSATPHYYLGKMAISKYLMETKPTHKIRHLRQAVQSWQQMKSRKNTVLNETQIEALRTSIEEALQNSASFSTDDYPALVSIYNKAQKAGFKVPERTTIPKEMPVVESDDAANGEITVDVKYMQAANALFRQINEARSKAGLGTLQWDKDLARAAFYHAKDMATEDYFDHDSKNRINGQLQEAEETFVRIGKFYKSGFAHSENIAAGNSSPEMTYQQWFNSPGHYRNMFKSESTHAAVGVFYDPNSTFGWYWVFCGAKGRLP